MADKIPGALGKASHREGKDTLALGDASHSEGTETQAQGESSHAEGTFTASIGESSHTEGGSTVATGTESHAEGHGTFAKNFAQHVAGLYNEGTSDYTVHETGIGTSSSDRKNAFEIYFNGSVVGPQLTTEFLINGMAKNFSTVEFHKERERSQILIPVSGVIPIDFTSRWVNYRVDVLQEISFERPMDMIPGTSGYIDLFNQTLGNINVNFNDYWVNSVSGLYGQTEILSGDYSKLSLKFRCIDERSIEYEIVSNYTPHLPLQVDDANFTNILAINRNGDYLVS